MHAVDSQKYNNVRKLKKSKGKSKKAKKGKKGPIPMMANESSIVDFVGKQVHHTWNQNGISFVSVFCNEDTFVWNDLGDPDNIVVGVETYVKVEISDSVVQYSWKEPPTARDYGLTWTFNFDTGMVYGVIVNVFPDFNLNLDAPFTLVDGFEVAEGLTSCEILDSL